MTNIDNSNLMIQKVMCGYTVCFNEQCPMFRSDEKVRWAKGMTNIFTDDMPKKVEKAVRQALETRYNRTSFFEYRNGTRLIHPAIQEEIRSLFREAGWKEDVHFDSYVEDYDW